MSEDTLKTGLQRRTLFFIQTFHILNLTILLKEAFEIHYLVQYMTIQNAPEAVTTVKINTILTKVASENKGLHSAEHP